MARLGVGAAAFFALLTIVAASGALGQSTQGFVVLTAPPQIGRAVQPAALDTSLVDVASVARAQGTAAAVAAARADGIGVHGGLVHVIVAGGASAPAAVSAVGGRTDGSNAGLVDALVPPAALPALAASPDVDLVRPPLPHVTDAVSGEELSATNATALQAAGVTGAHTKVAIIDVGFGGLAAAQSAGEVPSDAVQVNLCPVGGFDNDEHGTAVAEIVHEMAPGAQLYLICIDDEVSLGQAEEYAKANGIRIVNHSVSWFNSGRGDGTGAPGTPDAIAADAAANGILWINSAGNDAQEHWSGAFVEGESGLPLNFFNNESYGDGVMIAPGGTACVLLKWDDWPSTTQDYDLFLLDGSFNAVEQSTNRQSSGGAPPTEDVCHTNTASTAQAFYAAIYRYSATTTPRFDMTFVGDVQDVQYAVAAGSVAEPASSPSVLAVGAVCRQDNSIEPYSSQGPTIDGRTKPDLVAPDSVSSATFGPSSGCGPTGFSGTSAAAPAVAGAAALLASLHPAWTASQIEDALKAQATDRGPAGADNQFGVGVLHLLQPATTHLRLAAPSGGAAGAPFSVTVSALDASNAVVQDYDGTVHFTSTDATAALPADYTFTAADHGVHTFSVTVRAVGSQTLTAADIGPLAVAGAATYAAEDVTKPVVVVTSPADGATYDLGAVVNADYRCSDENGGSGLSGCTGSVANGAPIDTASAGPHAFVVSAADHAGNAASVVRHYAVVAPVASPGGGGGGGGGGGSGVPPDLHVDLSASARSAPAVGSELVYSIRVSTKNVGSSSAVRLDLTLPAGYTITKTYSDRGPGCTGTAPHLVCDVAWISQGTATNVTVWGSVGQAGELDATATATSLVETEASPADNTATLKLLPVTTPAVIGPARPPKLTRIGSGTLRAAHVGKFAVLKLRVTVDKAVTLTMSAAGTRSPLMTVSPYRLLGPGTVPLTLRIPFRGLKRGHVYAVVLVARADGLSSRLVIPFRI